MAKIKCENCSTEMQKNADACTSCGHSNKYADHLSGIEVLVITLPAILLFWWIFSDSPSSQTSAIATQDLPLAERYPGPWTSDYSLEISKALVQNDVRGCGIYKYRKSAINNGEYLVYCSPDPEGKTWTAYMIWVPLNKLMGPYPPEDLP